jgi:hypothetical protein
MEAGQEEMSATIWAEKQKMEPTLSAIWPAQTIFKETIIKHVEGILASVD